MKKVVLLLIMVVWVAAGHAVNKEDSSGKNPVENRKATYVLRGTITDDKTHEAVAGASVTVNGAKYYSDFSGNFSIPALLEGTYTLSVDFISYQSQQVTVEVDDSRELMIRIRQMNG